MKTLLITLFAILLMHSGCAVQQKQPRIPKSYTVEQFYDNLSVYGAGFNSDESKILVGQNSTGIFNVYELTVTDTMMRPLTRSGKQSCFAVDYLPGTAKFIYTADKEGDENSHLFLMNTGDTLAKDLTPWPNSANQFLSWSADKKFMYILSNKRDTRFFDLWKLDTAGWRPVLLYQNDSSLSVSSVSWNERYLALTKDITSDKNDLYLYDRIEKTMKRISNDNEATWNPMAFEKNDSILFYVTNDNSEFSYLVKYHIHSGKTETWFSDQWDVIGMNLSERDSYHTLFINEDSKFKVLLFDHKTNQPIDLPVIEDGDVKYIIFSLSEQNILMGVGSSTSPSNLHLYNINSKTLKQLTSTLNPSIDREDLVTAEIIRFQSFDGKGVSAVYYKPHQADKKNKAGALVWVHGGPGGQSGAGFVKDIQILVNHGYAVLAVNNRGSSGYGKTFYKMDNKDHGNGDLKDCVWGKKWLAEKEYIDSNAIGITGGSYGGTMVLNALSSYPDEFKSGIDLFGVANWLRTLRSIPPYWEAYRKALYDEMGDPNTADSVRLKNASPINNYQKITKPLLIFQGANDVRVLKIESDEIAEGVKKNNVPVEYIVYPDEGHGFVKKENQINTLKTTLSFLEKYMKPAKMEN